MKTILTLALLSAFAAFSVTTFAQGTAPATPPKATTATPPPAATAAAPGAVTPPAAAPNSQQERMKDCNTQAEGKKGDERKTFMSSCLSGKEMAPAKMTQQEKMTACNKKAGDMKGDDRKKFMSTCLKG